MSHDALDCGHPAAQWVETTGWGWCSVCAQQAEAALPPPAPSRPVPPSYRCQRCDARIWWEQGEWGCACWTVSAQEMALGQVPPAWRPYAMWEGKDRGNTR
jgi:hypothetical protein